MRGLRSHIRKLELFSDWSGLSVNLSKTNTTCLEHGDASADTQQRMETELHYKYPLLFSI